MGRVGWILLALAGGFCLGLLLKAQAAGAPFAAALGIATMGQLWLNALRMTLVPLIFCLMAGGAASVVRQAGAGRIFATTIGLMALLLFLASAGGVLLALLVMSIWPPVPIDVALLRGGEVAPAVPGIIAQLLAVIPVNPVAAAAEAAMTPLIVFAAIFGAATTRLDEQAAQAVHGLIRGVGDTMLVIIGWVLRLAPIGVFLLALDAGLQIGATAAASMAQYVLLLSVVLAGAVIVAMGIGIIGGRATPRRFIKAASPALAIAASTQSSMACLPALLQSAEDELHLPPPIVQTVLPFAISTFRFGNVFGGTAAALIGAHMCGIHPGSAKIALAAVIGVLTNIGVIGLPGAAVLFAAYGPIFATLGTPFELLTLLVAVFTIPDILDTSANVTADLSLVAIVSRLTKGRSIAAPK